MWYSLDHTLHTLTLVQRETISNLRSWKIYMAVAALVLGVGYMVTTSLPSEFDYAMSGMYSRTLMMFYWAFLIILGSALIPLIAAVSFGNDIQRRTFELLRMAPYTPGQILSAKLLSLIILFVHASLVYLPIIGVLFFYIGVDYTELLMAYGISVLYMLVGLSIGLYASVTQLQPLRAITRTIVLSIGFLIIHFLAVAFFAALPGSAFGPIITLFLVYPVVMILFILGLLFTAFRILRRKLKSDQMLWIQNTGDSEMLTAGVFYRDEREKKSSVARRRVSLNRIKLGVLLAVLGLLTVLFMYAEMLKAEGLLVWMTAITGFLCAVIAIHVAVVTVRDHIAGTLDMLRMTLLQPHRIILLRLTESLRNAKFLAGLGLAFILVPLLHNLGAGTFDHRGVLLLLCIPPALVQAALLGQFGALFARQYATAIIFALAALAGGMWLFMMLSIEAISLTYPKDYYEDGFNAFNFLANDSPNSNPVRYFLILNGVRVAMMLILLVLNVLIYAVLHHRWRPAWTRLPQKGTP